ncbi:hypothetical protein AVEN_266967-1 [Araneus ventricosus]|uniref:Reverse transcriptase RNase H-like domain-containing protein n=1 Tax=Araneus ventricosus TaxID=182803 RepID=A0A4Y2HM30_ARAVE|nr:hypothetical protein AVEN_266967-1 [Araneus ventricosus]
MFRTKLLDLDLNLRRRFQWKFTIAHVKQAIIGVEFSTNFEFLVDVKNNRLIDAKTKLSSSGFRVKNYDLTLNLSFLSEPLPEFVKILSEFPSVTNPSMLGKQSKSTVVFHHIETSGPLDYSKPRSLVEGRPFVIFTDHRPLIYAFNKKSDSCSPRQLRQLDFISQFSIDIRHVSDADNVVADALSRINIMLSTTNFEDMAKAQQFDEELKNILSDPKMSIQLRSLTKCGTVLRCVK